MAVEIRGDGQGSQERGPVEEARIPIFQFKSHSNDQPQDHHRRHKEQRVDEGSSYHTGEQRVLRLTSRSWPIRPTLGRWRDELCYSSNNSTDNQKIGKITKETMRGRSGGAGEAPPGEVYGADETAPPAGATPRLQRRCQRGLAPAPQSRARVRSFRAYSRAVPSTILTGTRSWPRQRGFRRSGGIAHGRGHRPRPAGPSPPRVPAAIVPPG